jgi:hypothetical protein
MPSLLVTGSSRLIGSEVCVHSCGPLCVCTERLAVICIILRLNK